MFSLWPGQQPSLSPYWKVRPSRKPRGNGLLLLIFLFCLSWQVGPTVAQQQPVVDAQQQPPAPAVAKNTQAIRHCYIVFIGHTWHHLQEPSLPVHPEVEEVGLFFFLSKHQQHCTDRLPKHCQWGPARVVWHPSSLQARCHQVHQLPKASRQWDPQDCCHHGMAPSRHPNQCDQVHHTPCHPCYLQDIHVHGPCHLQAQGHQVFQVNLPGHQPVQPGRPPSPASALSGPSGPSMKATARGLGQQMGAAGRHHLEERPGCSQTPHCPVATICTTAIQAPPSMCQGWMGPWVHSPIGQPTPSRCGNPRSHLPGWCLLFFSKKYIFFMTCTYLEFSSEHPVLWFMHYRFFHEHPVLCCMHCTFFFEHSVLLIAAWYSFFLGALSAFDCCLGFRFLHEYQCPLIYVWAFFSTALCEFDCFLALVFWEHSVLCAQISVVYQCFDSWPMICMKTLCQ